MEYTQRTYRSLHRQGDLVHFQVSIKETDLDIGIRRDRFSPELVHWVEKLVLEGRSVLEAYIQRDPVFQSTLVPHQLLENAPKLALDMADASKLAGVGPMAAVAGAFAEYVGKALGKRSRDVIVENGGDIYMRTSNKRTVGIFAGPSPFTNKIGLEIQGWQTPIGICTSSGTVGHSLSFGKSDAIIVLSQSAPLADAVATAAGNLVQTEADLQSAVDFASGIPGISGAIAIKGEKLAAWGQIKLVPL